MDEIRLTFKVEPHSLGVCIGLAPQQCYQVGERREPQGAHACGVTIGGVPGTMPKFQMLVSVLVRYDCQVWSTEPLPWTLWCSWPEAGWVGSSGGCCPGGETPQVLGRRLLPPEWQYSLPAHRGQTPILDLHFGHWGDLLHYVISSTIWVSVAGGSWSPCRVLF